jgi:hypothetical protein
MSFMNVAIYINGTNISSHVIQYRREAHICTMVEILDIILDGSDTTDYSPWDTVTINEGGSLVGTYYINKVSKDSPDFTRTLNCQNASKKLEDYFIPQAYKIDYASNSLYWIETFLTQAQISYSIQSGVTGVLLSNPTALGQTTAMEAITQLLEMSGLYLYFDVSGTAIVGKLNADLSNPSDNISEENILSVKVTTDDKLLRNRVVVWGSGDPAKKNWVFADVSTTTKWNYSSSDSRTTVLQNSSIPNISSAYVLANILINELARITTTKEVSFAGTRGTKLGDIVFIHTSEYSGTGLVTSLVAEMSSQGLLTTITLDERCPRMFGYFAETGDVYVGTNSSGVWRKKIDDLMMEGWSDYSTGLEDLCVTDLYKNNGILSCVTSNGLLYERWEPASSWVNIPLSHLPTGSGNDITYVEDGIMARAVTQDRYTNHVHAIVDTLPGDNLRNNTINTSGIIMGWSDQDINCWVVEANPYNGSIIDSHQVVLSGSNQIAGFDIDNNGTNDFVSVSELLGFYFGGTGSEYGEVSGTEEGWRNEYPNTGDENAYSNSLTPTQFSIVDDKLVLTFDDTMILDNQQKARKVYTTYFYTPDDGIDRDFRTELIFYAPGNVANSQPLLSIFPSPTVSYQDIGGGSWTVGLTFTMPPVGLGDYFAISTTYVLPTNKRIKVVFSVSMSDSSNNNVTYSKPFHGTLITYVDYPVNRFSNGFSAYTVIDPYGWWLWGDPNPRPTTETFCDLLPGGAGLDGIMAGTITAPWETNSRTAYIAQFTTPDDGRDHVYHYNISMLLTGPIPVPPWPTPTSGPDINYSGPYYDFLFNIYRYDYDISSSTWWWNSIVGKESLFYHYNGSDPYGTLNTGDSFITLSANRIYKVEMDVILIPWYFLDQWFSYVGEMKVWGNSEGGMLILNANDFVLKRTGNDFEVVESGYNHRRLDLSASTPLIMLTSGLNDVDLADAKSLITYFGNSTDDTYVNDFRYSIFEPEEVGNNTLSTKLIYTVSGNLQSVDITDISNISQPPSTLWYNDIDNVVLEKVEVTNHKLPSQYVFVSTNVLGSGSFFQSDPVTSGIFMEENINFPADICNIIRCDDVL